MNKVVIIDDEPLARSIVVEYLQQHSSIEIAAECNDGFQGVKAIMQHKPDLIFLDIQMPDGTGFDLLEQVQDKKFEIIFTTATDKHALKAIKYSACDYLLKPLLPVLFL